MSGAAEKTDPKLWDKIKTEVTKGDKGGKSGQWSARKAQLATNAYKHEGGGYKGEKSDDNHLKQWGEEDWGTKSGKPSGQTGERYLPKEARDHLTKEEYDRTTAKKRADSRKGRQYSAQPGDVAKKTTHDRDTGRAHGAKTDGRSKAHLYVEAKKHDVPGRSKMNKAELEKALAGR